MLNEIQFGHHMTRSGLHQVTARHNQRVIGGLQWYPDDDPEMGTSKGEIATVGLLPEYQRQGIATGMLNHARGLASQDASIPEPQGSSSRSPAGTSWLTKRLGEQPENTEPHSEYSDSGVRSLVSMMARS